jgi:O-antigen ligase
MLQKNYKSNIFFLDWAIFLLPISMIVGNAAININCVIIALLFLLNTTNKKNLNFLKRPKIIISLFIFVLFFSLNIYFSVHPKISLISFFGIIKYIFLVLAFLYCFKNVNLFIHKFSKLTLIVLILVCLDVLVQYFFGADVFGNKIQSVHGLRLSGPFGDEYIVGSYIGKFALVSLFFLNKEKKIYEYLYLLFVLGIVILSNERAAALMCFASIVVYFLLTPNLKFNVKLINLSVLGILIVILFNFNAQLKEHFIKRTFQQFGLIQGNTDYKHNSFWDSRWGAHFLTAAEIIKNKPIIGSGLHTFRIECKDQIYEKIKSVRIDERCNTHPHNFYLEIWSELGTLFFIFFIIFNIYFLFKLFKVYFFNRKYQQDASIIISLYFMLFFPIQTTGALFSTWNGVIYWIAIALCLNLFTKSAEN